MPQRFFKGRKVFKSQEEAGVITGFRSGLEKKLSEELEAQGVPYLYEKLTIRFIWPARDGRYKPDWLLTSNGIIIESKGVFDVEDRQKHLLVQAQHPDLDIRFVFSSSRTKLYPNSPTSYGDWCKTHGFQFADKSIPKEWITEPPMDSRIRAIESSKEEPDMVRWSTFKLTRSKA